MILVTGGTGLVGSHLIYELLKKGERVRVLYRKSGNRDKILRTFSYYQDNARLLYEKIEWIEGNVLDYISLEDAMEGVDKVYHTAALVSYDPFNRRKILYNNIQGTANIVNACQEKGVKKLCHVSSVAAIGNVADRPFITEDLIWSPTKNRSAYAVSKFHSEMEVWRGIEEGLNAIIVNPSFILGPGDWEKSSSTLFSTIAKGLRFYTPGINGYVDVRDVTKAMITLMDSDITAQRYILNSENCSFKDVFQWTANSLGVKEPNVKVKPWMGALAWRAEWLKSLFLRQPSQITKDTVAAGFAQSLFSNEKIRKAIGIEFIPVKQSIEETAKIFLKERNSHGFKPQI
jgi:dihydroflavonol-4-reductase